LHVFVIASAQRDKLVVGTGLTDPALLDEVSENRTNGQERDELQDPSQNKTHMQSAFWIVDSRWAIANVVRPLAALSRAAWTTFSELESRADVAYQCCLVRYCSVGAETNTYLIQEQNLGIPEECSCDGDAFCKDISKIIYELRKFGSRF
jgi:hypothetical protein